MRITTVKHAKKPKTCSKCGAKIKPSRNEKKFSGQGTAGTKIVRVLGDGYRWIKFNRGPKVVRCMKPECAFKRSDMTRSEKLGNLYAAQESAEVSVSEWSGDALEDLKSTLEELAGQVREIAEEYRESADNIRQTFNESPTADDCEEKCGELENWADELESVDFEDYDEDEPNDEQEDKRERWIEEQRDKAEEAVGNCPY